MRILLRVAIRNTLKNWRHSLAAVLSIATGVLALGLFDGYTADLRAQYDEGFSMRNMLGDVIIEKAGAQEGIREEPWRYLLDEREQAFVEGFLDRSGGVVARVRFLGFSGLASNGRTSAIIIGAGYDVAQGELVRGPRWASNAVAGRTLGADDTHAVMLGKTLGQIFDCAPLGARLPQPPPGVAAPPVQCQRKLQITTTTREGRINAVDTRVVGLLDAVLKELDSRYTVMPLPLAQRLLDTKGVSMYSVKLAERADADAFARRLRDAARQQGIELNAVNWRSHRLGELYRRGTEVLGIFRAFVTLVVLVVASVSVIITLYKAVSERTREIGTLRSIGFLRRHIVLLFGLEGGILALLASLLGVIVTVPLAYVLSHAGITYRGGLAAEPIPLVIAIVPATYAVTVLMLSAMAVVAAVVPARRAAAMKIPDALGHL